MIVVGLTGKAGAGKSAVADYLAEKYGFTKLSFAGPLKKMLRTLDPIVDHQHVWDGFEECMTGPLRLSNLTNDEVDLKEYYPEYRRLLQVLGTDCIRAIDEDFWVRAAMQQLTDLNGRYVFDDVRFPNEAEAVRGGGLRTADTSVWFINRPQEDDAPPSHASELWAGEMQEDVELLNVGSHEHLYAQVDRFMGNNFEQVSA